MIRLLIFLLAAGFGDTRNPSNASLPIWLHQENEPKIFICSTNRAVQCLYIAKRFTEMADGFSRQPRHSTLASSSYSDLRLEIVVQYLAFFKGSFSPWVNSKNHEKTKKSALPLLFPLNDALCRLLFKSHLFSKGLFGQFSTCHQFP